MYEPFFCFILFMIVTRLKLNHYRNHTATNITCGAGINLITGPNGAGKTNLIDAIHYVCMSRSFVSSSDMYVVKQGESAFSIETEVEGQIRSHFSLSCKYSRGDGKIFFVNDSPLERLADLIGIVPVVVLSPDDRKITSEGPAERRTFLDAMISQSSKSYLTDLIEYRKIVRQRNKLLSGYFPDTSVLKAILEPWDYQLIHTGSRIIAKRTAVLHQFSKYLEAGYEKISDIKLRPWFEYKTICEPSVDEETIRNTYSELLREAQIKEIDRQMTLIGPHRDDLTFFLDDMELRKFGSQGQHRLFALSLKMAELHFFSETLDDLPVFLLDDVFGDLDPSKIKVLTEMLAEHPGQSFVTAANEAPFKGLISFSDEKNKRFQVEPGAVIQSTSE